jgi:hypothetical protein
LDLQTDLADGASRDLRADLAQQTHLSSLSPGLADRTYEREEKKVLLPGEKKEEKEQKYGEQMMKQEGGGMKQEEGEIKQENPEFPTKATNAEQKTNLAGQAVPGIIKSVYPETEISSNRYDGDKLETNITTNHSEATMRPGYGQESAQNVIPSTKRQLASDIQFDMFDFVPEGYGNGGENKLFLMQQGRDERIIMRDPLDSPGQWIGPVGGDTVMPWQWQRVMPEQTVNSYRDDQKVNHANKKHMYTAYSGTSSNVLGDDFGYNYRVSCKGLTRKPNSPFEPIYRTDIHWQHVKPPCGSELNKVGFRRDFDSRRYPLHTRPITAGSGGPVWKKRRGLEVILP